MTVIVPGSVCTSGDRGRVVWSGARASEAELSNTGFLIGPNELVLVLAVVHEGLTALVLTSWGELGWLAVEGGSPEELCRP